MQLRQPQPGFANPDNAVGLVGCELSGYAKLASFWRQMAGKFSHRPGNPAVVGVVRWPSAGDTAGCRLCRPKLAPVSLISAVWLASVRSVVIVNSKLALVIVCNNVKMHMSACLLFTYTYV